MQLRGIHRLAAVTGATVLATAMTGAAVASARTLDTVCGPEVEFGSVVYQTCSDVLEQTEYTTTYGTQQYIEVRNRGFGSTTVSVTLQHYDYSTSTWVTDSTGSRTLPAGNSTRFFSPSTTWACGQDAHDRSRAEDASDVGAWSEAVNTPPC